MLVDAGYLLGGAYTLLTGRRSDRSRLRPEYSALIEAIRVRAEGETGLPVLRIYWYDAAFQRQPTSEHRALRGLRDVKVRLGNLVVRGEGPPQQKGVDAELHADLVTLARHRAVADVILVTGDEDLCVPVEKAQEYGVRVHLWAVPTSSSSTNQSPELVATADRRTVLERAWIDDHFTVGREPYAAVSVLPRPPGTGDPVRETPVDTDDSAPVTDDPAPGSQGDTAPAVPDDHTERGAADEEPDRVDTTQRTSDPGTSGAGGTVAEDAAGDGDGEGVPGTTDAGSVNGGSGPVPPSPVTVASVRGAAPRAPGTGLTAPRHAADPFEVGREYGTRWCRRALPEEYDEIAPDRPRIAAAIDRDLLRTAERRGVDTWSDEQAKFAVRDGFWRGVDFVRDLDEVGSERDDDPAPGRGDGTGGDGDG